MMARRTTKRTILALALSATLGMSACGSDGSTEKDKPSGRETVKSGGESTKALLPADDLPKGWRYATKEDLLGIPQMCDVVLEPPALTSAKTQRFARTTGEAFVIQYSFVSSDEAATTKRIDEFTKAAATCANYAPTKEAKAKVSPITTLTKVGDAFAAVHAVNAANPDEQRDYVVSRDGSHVTVLLSYGVSNLASVKELDSMSRSIADRVAAASS